MLVGGGSEKDAEWSWSNIPYSWAVEQAPNSKVAIISYSTSSDPEWLPDYFLSLGAVEATNFIVEDRSQANSATLYDALTEYDLLFFKGGDQSVYYLEYRNTELSRAAEDIFNRGGVIAGTSAGMAIISGIVYTAEGSSIFPDQALEGRTPELVTLKNDMFSFLPGVLSDTHFAERGRLSRLITFLGEAEDIFNDQIIGIGVDDQTAFCINQEGIGITYGTGAATIIQMAGYGEDASGRPSAESIVTSVLHGKGYDLSSLSLTTPYEEPVSPETNAVTIPYTLFLTGSTGFTANQQMFESILNENDQPVVFIGPDGSSTNNLAEGLESLVSDVYIISPGSAEDDCALTGVRNVLRSGATVVFSGNDFTDLQEFLITDETGKVVVESVYSGISLAVFLGKDAMLAGSRRVTNNLEDDLNAFYGDLAYDQGLSFLPSSIIVTEAYDPQSTDFYENNTAAVLYGVIQNELYTGILINEGSWVRIGQENTMNAITSGGEYSAMMITNTATGKALAGEVVNAAGDVRNIAGFDQVRAYLVNSQSVSLGEPEASDVVLSDEEPEPPANFQVANAEEGFLLTWSFIDSEEGDFVIERASGDDDFELLAQVTSEERSYLDASVQVNTSYQYRIRFDQGEATSCYAVSEAANLITDIIEDQEGVIIYPNPASEWIFIQGIENGVYQLMDLQGRQVMEGNTIRGQGISVGQLKAGFYMLLLRTSEATFYKKICIERDSYPLTGK
jgi:cyanophycinase